MPDLKALNDIHAVHLTAMLRLSSSLHICICVYIRDYIEKLRTVYLKLYKPKL